MNALKLALRNVKRHTRRSLLTAMAIAVTVCALIFANSYFRGLIISAYAGFINTEAGHIRIAHKEYVKRERMLPLDRLVNDTPEITSHLQEIHEINTVLPRLKFHVMLNHAGKNEIAIGIGIEPEKEKTRSPVFEQIRSGSANLNTKKAMLIGSGLAEKLRLNVGDSLLVVTRTVYYSQDAMVFGIAGIFHSGLELLDNNNFYINFETAELLLDAKNMASEILIYLDEANQSRIVAKRIEESLLPTLNELAVIPWQHHSILKNLIPYVRQVSAILYGIILFIAALVIFNTMLMAVLERTHEMGILMSMGMKGKSLVNLFILEALLIAVIGCLIGGILGCGLSLYVEKVGLDFSQIIDNVEFPIPFLQHNKMYPDFSAHALWQSVFLGILTALLATIFPCLKAAHLEPTEALRKI